VSMARNVHPFPFKPWKQAFRTVEMHAPGLVRTARMTLRPLRDSDRAEFLRVMRLSREHLERFSCLHREGETDDQLFERQLDMCRAGDQRGTAWRRVGVLDDGTIVGGFNLNAITRGLTFEADANWWVSADQARRGLGFEGAAAMLEHALADIPVGLGLHKIHAAIMPGNIAGKRLAAKLGLRPQLNARVSIRIGDRWEFHEVYARSVLDSPVTSKAG
jgi:ribosomal-protein-alanine N-acetyltransferase